MGLDNIPEPYPCTGKETTIMTRDGKIDCEATRENGICPVLNHNHPIGMLGTYCWFRGKVITIELEALGYSDLAEEFYSKKSLEEIESLLKDVKEVYKKIKESHKDNGKPLKGAGWNGCFKDGKFEWQTYSTYEDIISEFENTIRWLEMLIENNCGFRAWY